MTSDSDHLKKGRKLKIQRRQQRGVIFLKKEIGWCVLSNALMSPEPHFVSGWFSLNRCKRVRVLVLFKFYLTGIYWWKPSMLSWWPVINSLVHTHTQSRVSDTGVRKYSEKATTHCCFGLFMGFADKYICWKKTTSSFNAKLFIYHKMYHWTVNPFVNCGKGFKMCFYSPT